MNQGAAHGAWSTKADAAKASVPSQATGVGRANVTPRAQDAPKNDTKPFVPAAPAAPKLQTAPATAPAATQAAKPIVPPPLPSGQRLVPNVAEGESKDDEPTRVAAAPVAVHKTASPSPPAALQVRPQTHPQAGALQRPEAREDMRPFVRSMVEQAMAPYDRKIREMQQRLEELENRPAPAPVVISTPARTPVSPGPRPYVSPPNQAVAPAFDEAAIARSAKLDPEMAVFDGRRRRLRLALAVAFACVIVFGGLFAALAQSYTHTHG